MAGRAGPRSEWIWYGAFKITVSGAHLRGLGAFTISPLVEFSDKSVIFGFRIDREFRHGQFETGTYRWFLLTLWNGSFWYSGGSHSGLHTSQASSLPPSCVPSNERFSFERCVVTGK